MTLGACGGSKLGGTGTGGAGGTGVGGFGGFETGGFPATGGTFDGWGGSPGEGGGGGDVVGAGGYGLGGSPGTGGFATGGGPGSGGSPFPGGAECSAPTTGPLTTSDLPRPFGWTFTGPTADAGSTGAGGAAGNTGSADGGATPALCRTVPAAYPGTACTGMASLRSNASGPLIIFADGSELVWDGTLPSALEPYVAQASGGGDSVWVDYEKRITVVCPFCGTYTTYTLEIRNGHDGPVRFYDQAGDVLPNLTDAQVMDIFGTTATAVQTCTFPAIAGCSQYLRSEFDHQLGSQTLLDATLTEVTAPNGKFQVIWASSAESYVEPVPADNCDSLYAPGVATDTGFVATLLSP
jgi:hypothetical protein